LKCGEKVFGNGESDLLRFSLSSPSSRGAGKAGRSRMFEHEGIKEFRPCIYTDIFETPGDSARSFESAAEDGEETALKI
jgi:hypothetical protein